MTTLKPISKASDAGIMKASQFTATLHSDPTPSLDCTKVSLPNPFNVCIVGASRGIGAGIAYSYAGAGATGLVLSSRRVSGLEETAARCREINPKIEIEIVACDITSSTAVATLAVKAKARFQHLNVVAVNSGYSGPIVTRITEGDPETFFNATNVNYTGTFYCAKFLLPLLLASPPDSVRAFVAVNSLAALIVRGPIANTQYCVSKTAQMKLVEHVHEQFHGEGVSAFAVHPGAVLSEMAEETAPEEFMQYLKDSPDLCGSVCVWLTKGDRAWLSGRFVSANWDMEELEARKEEVIEKDLLKLQLSL